MQKRRKVQKETQDEILQTQTKLIDAWGKLITSQIDLNQAREKLVNEQHEQQIPNEQHIPSVQDQQELVDAQEKRVKHLGEKLEQLEAAEQELERAEQQLEERKAQDPKWFKTRDQAAAEARADKEKREKELEAAQADKDRLEEEVLSWFLADDRFKKDAKELTGRIMKGGRKLWKEYKDELENPRV